MKSISIKRKLSFADVRAVKQESIKTVNSCSVLFARVLLWCGPGQLSRYSDSLLLDDSGIESCRSQWPRGLRRESAANRLLGLRV